MSAGLLLAIFAALAWGGLDSIRKGLAGRMTPIAVVTVMTAGQGLVFLTWAVADGAWFEGPSYLLPGSICLVLNVLANVLFVESVRVSPLSVTVPFLSLSPVFAALAGIPLLAEFPSALQWTGMAAVVAGALALNAGGARHVGEVLAAFGRERGSVLMTIVALCWAVTVGLDKRALEHAGTAAHGSVQTAGVAVATLAILLVRRATEQLAVARRNGGLLLAAVVVGSLALGLQLLAVQHVMVGVVETIKRALGLVMAVVLGRVLFAEQVGTTKIVSITIMMLGTAAVILG